MAQRVRVFISHSARDGEANTIRQSVYARLKNDPRYAVLMDDKGLDPGDAWRARINLWLGACDAAIVILSKNALHSPYVAFELSILGYRRWREQREGHDLRIIPVLAGVTMAVVNASLLLAPAQLSEAMAVDGGEAAFEERIVSALDGVVPMEARPIERMARALHGYLPATEESLIDAAAALEFELPWEAGETKRFSLALRMLGSGMSIPTVKAVRRLRDDPTFQRKHLQTIVELLSSAWVDLKANDIPELVTNRAPPALVLNASFTDTAKMYLCSARYRVQPTLKYRLAEPNIVIEERPNVEEHRARIVEAVRQSLFTEIGVSTDEELKTALEAYLDLREAVIVALHVPSPDPVTLRELRETFEHVTFFLLTGTGGDAGGLPGETVHIIRPPLGDSDEEQCRKQYDQFCQRIIHLR